MALPPRPHAVVTGAASGLGRALCNVIARRGGKVLAADVNLEGAEETARAHGDRVKAVRCDVSRRADVEALAEEATRFLDTLDLVVNNAGVAVAGAVGEVPTEDWHWIMGVNLWGPIYGCEVFVPKLKAQRSGHVLNVASAAGLISSPFMAPYNVTKAGVVALSETLSGELADHGVGVSVLCPTFFPTNIAKNSRATDQKLKALASHLVDGGKTTPEQVAELALAGCAADDLYIVPHADGRWMWRMKRLMPERFGDLAPRAVRMMQKRFGG